MTQNQINVIKNIMENIIHKYDQGQLTLSSFNNIDDANLISVFYNIFFSTHGGKLDGGKIKNYKMEYYFKLYECIINKMNIMYENNNLSAIHINKLDKLLKDYVLEKITKINKGQFLLNKLDNRIKRISNNEDINKYLVTAAEMGTFATFLYWLNKIENKKLEKLPNIFVDQIYTGSISNSDDRLFKYILNHMDVYDKLFFFKNKAVFIVKILNKLEQSAIPIKYKLKRIKKLSEYISLIPYFNNMIEIFNSGKMLLTLHKYYYTMPHDYNSLNMLINKIQLVGLQTNDIFNVLKTEDEKIIYQIIRSIKLDQYFKITNLKLFEKIVINNYKSIIKDIEWKSFILSLDDFETNKQILKVLTQNNLVTKYVMNTKNNITCNKILFYTRFLNLKYVFGKHSVVNHVTPVNYILHKLRLLVKKKLKTKFINYNVKMFDVLNEISNYKPNKYIPVLSNGSKSFQFRKQRFSNLPPRNLLPGELLMYKNFLLREKADGLLINNLPIGIYPIDPSINNYQVKAEYIENLDLYLIFDINIPNTTIVERYNYLRSLHPVTKHTHLKTINSLDDMLTVFDEERVLITKFLNDNKNKLIKWYPKFACLYNYNNNKTLYHDIINQVFLQNSNNMDKLINSKPYNCDGLILSPLNGNREIKIKPKSLLSIDLLFNGNAWIDKEKNDWSNIIVTPSKPKKIGRIYRFYPMFSDNNLKFVINKSRYDKKYPNTYSIIDNIINIINYEWTNDLNDIERYYYEKQNIIKSKKLIEIIKIQNNLLNNNIQNMSPLCNSNWLDLGCGKGKLVSIIKKYVPKYYLGLDIDIKQLVLALKYHDENQNVYHFNPCNLSKDWNSSTNKWYNFNENIKFDYIVANFSLMHFCTETFWEQLNRVVNKNSKFMFNIVNPNRINQQWSESESFLRIDNDTVNYKFEWTHDSIKTEPLIDTNTIMYLLNKYNWNILKIYSNNTSNDLYNFYDWWLVEKN